ncbi:hypothetical protein B7486_02595 [cyanobacterium TDX16]|nr:hypothetical protein B7486_02595 [cyanobacterium TDX16]
MRPRCLVLVCLFVAVALPTPLMGAGAVYFTAASASPAGSVSHQGARGEALELECDVNVAFTCTWDISGWYQNDDGGAFGWSLDVGILDPSVFGKATVSNIEIPINEVTTISHLVGANEPNGFLIHGAAGANLSGPGPAIWNVLNFRVTKTKAMGDPQVLDIFSGVGFLEFGGNDPEGLDFYEIIQIGPNSPAIGIYAGIWPYGALPLPVITVTNIPEPAAIGLFGSGILLLTRRRKCKKTSR